jgi:nickel-dependent lactate racemase
MLRGASAGKIVVAVASGTHRPSEHELSASHLGELPPGVRVRGHDADGPWRAWGRTAAGTLVEVDHRMMMTNALFALGSVVFHYFAGFGGGGKMLFPGLGGRDSIASNHRLALAPWPPGGLAEGVEPGRLDGNPVAIDLAEAHAFLPEAHHLSLWPVTGGYAGGRWSARSDFEALCARYAANRRVGERAAYDLVFAECTGPGGIDVVQAHKALFHAALYARDGGQVILEAPCPEGIGSAAMARWLAAANRDALERDAREHYDLNAQTAISLAAIARRVRVTWIAREPLPLLDRWDVRVTHDADAEFARALAAARAGARVVRLPAPTDVLPAAS